MKKLDYAIDYITPYYKRLAPKVQERFRRIKSLWARNLTISGEDQVWAFGVVKFIMIAEGKTTGFIEMGRE